MKEKIACIAGTPVDTAMGVDLLIKNGFDAFSYPSSINPVEEMHFQVSSADEKHKKILGILKKIKADGINKVLVYCNSLASAVDFKRLSEETGIKIVTPLDVYISDAANYNCLGVIAANAVATKKIEEMYLKSNSNISIISIGMLSLVISIEEKIEPKEIIKKHDLKSICDWFFSNGAEALLLGCTHFPYVMEGLKKVTDIPLIDPSKEMLDIVTRN